MRKRNYFSRGFTVIELLVALSIIGILGSLLFPVLSKAKGRAGRASCFNNLREINLAVRMYADDFKDKVAAPPGLYRRIEQWFRYKELVSPYLGHSALESNKLFACPADKFFYSASGYHSKGLCEARWTGFSSYIFNGGNLVGTNGYPGISGASLATVSQPSKTVLVCEAAAFTPFSWHQPNQPHSDYRFKDSRNILSFVDGHIQYLKMYWRGVGEAWQYDPPANYDYNWSGSLP